MVLQDKLDALKVKFETSIAPPEMVPVMQRVTDELIASGQAERALKAGDRAPTFTLPDPEGKPVSSQDRLGKGPLGRDLLPRRLVSVLQSRPAGA